MAAGGRGGGGGPPRRRGIMSSGPSLVEPGLVARALGSLGQRGKDQRGRSLPWADAPGVPARDRRHGDPFPLPSPRLVAGPEGWAPSRQRHRRVLAAVHSLNSLAAATLNSRRALGHDNAPQARLGPTAVQTRMLEMIQQRVKDLGAAGRAHRRRRPPRGSVRERPVWTGGQANGQLQL